jgi:hypothetical protein
VTNGTRNGSVLLALQGMLFISAPAPADTNKSVGRDKFSASGEKSGEFLKKHLRCSGDAERKGAMRAALTAAERITGLYEH